MILFIDENDQLGFGVVKLILTLVVAGLVGLAGWYAWSNDKSKSSQPVKTTNSHKQVISTVGDKKKYDSAKTAKISNFDRASDSLKAALINVYYDDAKNNCDQENASVSAEARLDWVMTVQKMVRDDFAGVQFCGSGGTSIMVHTNKGWERVGSLAMAPGCSLVDQYKISKEITPTCYLDDRGSTREVTYP